MKRGGSMHVEIEPAKADQSPAIAHLLKTECLPEDLHPYLAYAQAGAHAYLREAFEGTPLAPDRDHLVALTDSRVSGYAEFRQIDGTGFLSYLCVATHARGSGIGRRLIDAYRARRPWLARLELDVYEENVNARAFYEHLGFDYMESRIWVTRPAPAVRPLRETGLPTPTIVDWPHAVASHDRYGFCMLTAKWKGRAVRLGRIGADTVNYIHRTDFEDLDLAEAIQSVLPHSRDFAILSHSPALGGTADATRIATSLRMGLDL
jgi:ribosomal protein S18 acetylase RimI-like enzyme